MLHPRQIRAARALLDWEASLLAKKAGLTKEAISRIESGKVRPHEASLIKISNALTQAGVAFTENEGVQMRPHATETLEGAAVWDRLYSAIEAALESDPDFVLLASGVKLGSFSKRLNDLALRRRAFKIRWLLEDGDTSYAGASYAAFRWLPKSLVMTGAFFVIGDLFVQLYPAHDPAPLGVFIASPALAEATRRSFAKAWEHAIVPPA